VVKLEKQDALLHVIQFNSSDIDVEAFIKASIKERWGLFQISPHITSLEDTFVQLTNQ
jgi:ABC-2 type transport system ATP-binding protein